MKSFVAAAALFAGAALAQNGTVSMTTGTVYSTTVVTVTSCPETVTNCPAKHTPTEVTKVIPITTTVCPVASYTPPPVCHKCVTETASWTVVYPPVTYTPVGKPPVSTSVTYIQPTTTPSASVVKPTLQAPTEACGTTTVTVYVTASKSYGTPIVPTGTVVPVPSKPAGCSGPGCPGYPMGTGTGVPAVPTVPLAFPGAASNVHAGMALAGLGAIAAFFL